MVKQTQKSLMDKTRESVQKIGSRLFRNNVGVARFKKSGRDQVVRYGLAVGTSDLIGWTPVTVTTEMVGHQVAVFTALEGKTGRDKLSDEQRAFLIAVHNAGGISGVFSSGDKAVVVVLDGTLQIQKGK